MQKKSVFFTSIILIVILALSSFVIGCDDDDEETAVTPEETTTPEETLTPEETVTPEETMTPEDTATPAQSYKIGITQIVTHPALDANKQGFIDQMAEAGFIEGQNVTYIDKNPEGDMTLASTIAQQFVDEDVDLILAIATPTAQACVAATEGTDIPVLFGSVTDPVAAELIEDWDQPGGNVTGISDWLEIPSMVQMMIDIMPDIETLGTVYNPAETNAVVQVDALKEAAPSFGISEVVEGTSASTADVLTAAESLVGRVDAIWVGTDNTVVAAFEALVKVCEDNDIPLFASDVDSVNRGAIAALGMDYYKVGLSCGVLGARILNGENPGDIPAEKIDLADLELYVNPGAAEAMGITIPQEIIDSADQVVDNTATE